MLDFGANPIERQLVLSAQFLHNELPVRLAHRVAELENLPFGLSAKSPVLKVWRPPCWLHMPLHAGLPGLHADTSYMVPAQRQAGTRPVCLGSS